MNARKKKKKRVGGSIPVPNTSPEVFQKVGCAQEFKWLAIS